MKTPYYILPDPVRYDAKAHHARLKKLYSSYTLNTKEREEGYLSALLEGIPADYHFTFYWAIKSLLMYEGAFIDLGEPGPSDEKTEALYSLHEEYLTRGDENLERITRALVGVIGEFKRSLPKTKGSFTVPLIELIPNPAGFIQHLVRDYVEDNLPVLGDMVIRNLFEASGMSYGMREQYTPAQLQRLTKPADSELPPLEMAHAYLKATPLLSLLTIEVSIELPTKDRWPAHGIILAPSEWGKSMLIGCYLRQMFEDPEQVPLFLLDPHGDLFRDAAERAPPERTIIIDPDTNPPDLNLLDYGVLSDREALNTFKFLMSSLAGGLTPKQETCLAPLFGLLKNIPNANLVTLFDIISEMPKRVANSNFAEPISRLDPIFKSFFENLFYSGSFQDTKDALQWKLGAALGESTFKKMFSAQRNSITVDRFIDERKIVLVKGGEQSLGREGMRLFLLFLIGQYYAAGKRRDRTPEHQRSLAMMFVDEAHLVLQSPVIAEILTELRKYKFAFCAATQFWEQVSHEVRPAVLGSTGTKIVGKLQHNDAIVLARDMDTTPSVIQSLKTVPRSHSEWCFYVRSVTDQAMKVSVPFGVLQSMPIHQRKPLPESAVTPLMHEVSAPPHHTPQQKAESAQPQRQTFVQSVLGNLTRWRKNAPVSEPTHSATPSQSAPPSPPAAEAGSPTTIPVSTPTAQAPDHEPKSLDIKPGKEW